MMAFKLLAMAEERWRKVNGSELLPLVRAAVRFVDGVHSIEQEIAEVLGNLQDVPPSWEHFETR